jgi:hypothetical protein
MDSKFEQIDVVKDSSLSRFLSMELDVFVQSVVTNGLASCLAKVAARKKIEKITIDSSFMDSCLEITKNSFRESTCVRKLKLTRIGKALERSLTRKISSRLRKEKSLTLLFQMLRFNLKGVSA